MLDIGALWVIYLTLVQSVFSYYGSVFGFIYSTHINVISIGTIWTPDLTTAKFIKLT